MLTYVTENEYLELLGTDSIPNNFNQLNIKASNIINYKTQNRIDINDIPEKVKYVTCLLINLINEKEISKQETGNLTSTNIEGWSESYASRETTEQAYSKEIDGLLKEWLWDISDKNGQPLLYRGVPVIG